MTARHLPGTDPDPGRRGNSRSNAFYISAWQMAFFATREPGISNGLIQGLTPYLCSSLH